MSKESIIKAFEGVNVRIAWDEGINRVSAKIRVIRAIRVRNKSANNDLW